MPTVEGQQIRLTKSFARDYDAMVEGLLPGFAGVPYAFVRFGDGEGKIIEGRRHYAKTDGWKWTPAELRQHTAWIPRALAASLEDVMPDYHVGIPCEACSPEWHYRLLERVRTPYCNLTFAELFYYSNYRRWKAFDIRRCCIVGHFDGASIKVPKTIAEWTEATIERTVREMMAEKRPILVAAGPMACILIHNYWRATQGAFCRAVERQVVIDIGSAIDERFGRWKTRTYQWMRLRISRWSPLWKVSNHHDLLISRLRMRRREHRRNLG